MLFTKEEYKQRLKKVQASMQEKEIELLISHDTNNMNYLTGYDGWSFYVPQGVIVAIEKDEPIWFGRKQDSNGARITTFLKDENILGYPENLIQSPPSHPYDYVVNYIHENKWANKNIGVEMDSYYYTAENHERLVKNCPNAKFINGHLLVVPQFTLSANTKKGLRPSFKSVPVDFSKNLFENFVSHLV